MSTGQATKKGRGPAAGWFRRFAERSESALGSPAAFGIALGAVLLWAALGPHYRYSETWQIVVNTGTTVITFLMVFLLQNTQMRNSTAVHLKLDELLRAQQDARTGLVGLEKLPDEKLSELSAELQKISEAERRRRGVTLAPEPSRPVADEAR